MDDDYTNYVKCGEILKSPSIGAKNQYILKCFQCEDHYYLLESFQFPCEHWFDGYKDELSDEVDNSLVNDDDDDDEVQEEKYDLEDVKDKYDIMEEKCDPKDVMDNLEVDINIENVVWIPDETGDFEEEYKIETDDEMVDQTFVDEISAESSESLHLEDDTKTKKFVHNFMKSKKNVRVFIECYRMQSYLWDRSLPQFKEKKHRNICLEKIRTELKEQANLKISCKQIISIITFISKIYHQDLNVLKSNEDEEDETSTNTSWFFKYLEFLKPYAEKNLVPKVKQQIDLDPEQITQMLTIYEKFPHLWNTNLVEYCCQSKRQKAMDQMISSVEEEMDLNIDQNMLRSYIRYFHTLFSNEKRCIIRNTASKDACKYYQQMNFLDDHVGPFKCSECGIELKKALNFKTHQTQHDGLMHLKCSLCNKEFKTFRAYTFHVRRHMNDLKVVCKECGKRFINASDLGIHMRFHTGAKPFCCDICGASFRHIQAFNTHMRKHEKKYLHYCSICSKGFYAKAKLDDHIRSHMDVREFECKTCGKAFKTNKTLIQHQAVHEYVRKHACRLCDKKFKTKAGVSQHMKTHGSQHFEKPDESGVI